MSTGDSMPTFRNYVRAFGSSWFVAMSGPLSVPFAVAAVYVEGNWQKAGFAVLAIVCAVYASFSIWKVERIARNAAEDQADTLRAQVDSLRTEADTLRAEASALLVRPEVKPGHSPPPARTFTGFSFEGIDGLEAHNNVAIDLSQNVPAPPIPPKKDKGSPND
jgi:hypothetical protein